MNKLNEFEQAKKILFLFLRVWLGCVMIYNGRYIFTYANDTFWHHFFRDELNFPFPNLMFFLAKGSEFFGGLFLLLGFATRISAACIACSMLIATLFVNLKHIYGGYGSITLSYFLFSILFVLNRPDVFSIDYWIFRNKNRDSETAFIPGKKNLRLSFLFTGMRIWFASLLVFNGIYSGIEDKSVLFFTGVLNQGSSPFTVKLIWAGIIAEIICGLFIMIGLFSRIFSAVTTLCLVIAILLSMNHGTDFTSYYMQMIIILFWFACIFIILNSSQLH